MGSSKGGGTTVGYWYHILYHAGLGVGPIDAFLEFRAGTQVAWQGRVEQSGTININKPDLFGGKKDQGGIVSDVDLMFGEPTQPRNPYLLANLGAQIPGWRGLATLVFKGGKYGAMNPYPQKASYMFEKIKKGWDDPGCWYPEKAAIQVGAGSSAFDLNWTIRGNVHLSGYYNGYQVDYKQSSPKTQSLIFHSSDGKQRTVTLYYDGNVENKKISGGTLVANTVVKGGTPANDGNNLYKLHISSPDQTYYFNHTNTTYTGTVWAIKGSFDVKIDDGATVTFSWDAFDGVMAGQLQNLEVRDAGHYSGDAMNPAHILYYARTNGDMGRTPRAQMDDASFRAAADYFYTNGIGLCTDYDPSKESPNDFMKRIGNVAACSVNRSVEDGKWYLDVANGQYTLSSLPILTDDDILDFSDQPTILGDATNSIAVEYFAPAIKEQITTSPVDALALIDSYGTRHQVNQYHEIPSADIALRVAQRDLQANVTPTHAFHFTTNRTPYNWRPNTYFRLQAPKRGIADMVCILTTIERGTLRSGAIKITASQDVYSLPQTTFVQAEHGVDTRPSAHPSVITNQAVFEAPYTSVVAQTSSSQRGNFDSKAGLLMSVGANPGSAFDYRLMIDDGSGYAAVGHEDFTPTATVTDADPLNGAAPKTQLAISNAGDAQSVAIGTAALWGSEIVRVDAISATSVTLGRGCADTVPQAHVAGEMLWFYGSLAGFDDTVYEDGETVNAKLLTNTGSSVLNLADATALPVTFSSRIERPYPPADLQIAGSYYPASVTGSFAVTWKNRNRDLQADQLVDTTQSSTTLADNTRYGLKLTDSSGTVLVERQDIGTDTATVTLATSGTITLELWTIDNNNVSWQRQKHTFSYTPPSGSPTPNISATAYTPVSTTPIVDGGGP